MPWTSQEPVREDREVPDLPSPADDLAFTERLLHLARLRRVRDRMDRDYA
jgi:hypothetical protein